VEALRYFPQWREGPDVVCNFRSFFKLPIKAEKKLTCKPFWLSSGLVRPPSSLYPFVETSLSILPFSKKLPYSPKMKSWSRCTILMDSFKMSLVPYDPSQWRQSLCYEGVCYSHCVGLDMKTDLIQGAATDLTESEFFKALPSFLTDSSFVSWLSSPDFLVSMKVSDFENWECWSYLETFFFCFKLKLPKSLLEHKLSFKSLEWDRLLWNPNFIFNSFAKKNLKSLKKRLFCKFCRLLLYEEDFCVKDKCRLCDSCSQCKSVKGKKKSQCSSCELTRAHAEDSAFQQPLYLL